MTKRAEISPAGLADLLKSQDERRAELARMRAVATGLLLVMTGLFLLTRRAPAAWTFAPYVRAFAEAGMVGACADWFAVVAIFRRPLGLPIPHTAVVPENKKRLGAALGRFIATNFLSPRVALARLNEVDAVHLAARWLAEEDNRQAVSNGAARLLAGAVGALPRDLLAQWVTAAARRSFEQIPLAQVASRALAVVWAQGSAQNLLDRALDDIESWVGHNKGMLARKVREQSSKWIPKFVDDMIAAKIISGLLQTLRAMRAPGHPWRADIAANVAKWIDDLAESPDLNARAEAIKREALASPVFDDQVRALWREFEGGLDHDLDRRAQALASAGWEAAQALVRWVDEDPERRRRLNRAIRLWALRVVLPRRAEIGAYIADVVDRWNADTLVERLELQVGKDLQFIRLNGTLVGGLVGLLIYVLSEQVF